MLRHRSPVRLLGPDDLGAALELCAQDPVDNVFVAGRIVDGPVGASALHGVYDGDRLTAMVWGVANVVPVGTDHRTRAQLTDAVRRARRRCASILGPRDQVRPLWDLVGQSFPEPREIRWVQPVMTMSQDPTVELHPGVRQGRVDEALIVLPAAERMFTDEIGYRPYRGNPSQYLESIRRLLAAGRTYVVVEGGRVIFKADVGSCALGVAQVQGVWLDPALRGRGLAIPMMAAVVDQVRRDHAPVVSLYVNDFNIPALRTYAGVGMRQTGTYSTILF